MPAAFLSPLFRHQLFLSLLAAGYFFAAFFISLITSRIITFIAAIFRQFRFSMGRHFAAVFLPLPLLPAFATLFAFTAPADIFATSATILPLLLLISPLISIRAAMPLRGHAVGCYHYCHAAAYAARRARVPRYARSVYMIRSSSGCRCRLRFHALPCEACYYSDCR